MYSFLKALQYFREWKLQAINNVGSLRLLGSRRIGFIWKGEIYYSVFHINVLEGTRCSDLYFILGVEAA